MAPQMIQRTDLKTQTKRAIRTYINTMDLAHDNKLPREEQLCEIIGVSRVTLRSALNELESEGVILRRQGKGTFVNRTGLGIKATFNPAMHFGDVIANSGYTPHVRLLGWRHEPADEHAAEAFNIPAGTPCIRMRKMFYADQRPCVYCEDLFPAALWGETPLPDTAASVFQLLYDRTGRQVAWDKVELDVCSSESKPDLHQFGKQPLLLLKSLTYDSDDQPLFFAWEYIDTELLTLSQIRRREFPYTR